MFHSHRVVWRQRQPCRLWALSTAWYVSVGWLSLSVFRVHGWPCEFWMRFCCPVIHRLRLCCQGTWSFPRTSAGLPRCWCLAAGELCSGLLALGPPFFQSCWSVQRALMLLKAVDIGLQVIFLVCRKGAIIRKLGFNERLFQGLGSSEESAEVRDRAVWTIFNAYAQV